jgi:hypothetical protein
MASTNSPVLSDIGSYFPGVIIGGGGFSGFSGVLGNPGPLGVSGVPGVPYSREKGIDHIPFLGFNSEEKRQNFTGRIYYHDNNVEVYFKKGKIHREDGPAIVRSRKDFEPEPSKTSFYYLNDVEYRSEAEWKEVVEINKKLAEASTETGFDLGT